MYISFGRIFFLHGVTSLRALFGAKIANALTLPSPRDQPAYPSELARGLSGFSVRWGRARVAPGGLGGFGDNVKTRDSSKPLIGSIGHEGR